MDLRPTCLPGPELPVKRRSPRSAAAATRARLTTMDAAGVRPRQSVGPRVTEAGAGSTTGGRRRPDGGPVADRSALRDPGPDRELPRLTRPVIRGGCRLTGRIGRIGRVSPAVTRARDYRRVSPAVTRTRGCCAVIDRLGRLPPAVTRDRPGDRGLPVTRSVIRGCRPVSSRQDPAAATAWRQRRQGTNLVRRTAEGPVVRPPTARGHPPGPRPTPPGRWTAQLVQRWSAPGNPGPLRWCRRRGGEWIERQPPPSAVLSPR